MRARNGELVELRNLVRIEKGAAPSAITRTDRQRSVTVIGEPRRHEPATRRSRARRRSRAEILPPNLSLRLAGDAEQMKESRAASSSRCSGSRVLVIYMVLAAQFESFVQPLTVMLALPFAMIGALGGLWLGGMSLNLFSMIGIILLFGLVTKNSILLVDYAQPAARGGHGQGRGDPHTRRRSGCGPVLMTALAMIFGVLPAAIGIGPGAETRAPMASRPAAGMFSSTLLTLLVVPVFYLALDDAKAFLRSPREAARAPARGRARPPAARRARSRVSVPRR